jgi:tripartite-type tricarboxylate transporter receptor subunit TctC
MVSLFADWFTRALKAPEVASKLAVQGLFPVGLCGSDFGEFIRLQYEESGRAIKEANIKAQ